MSDSRGVLMFAHNNQEIDYFKIACTNALMVQHNLKVPVAMLTDEGTYSWAQKSLGQEFIDKCFKYVIVKDRDYVYQQNNPRTYHDTMFSSKSLPFYNCNHWMAYDITPFEETLFIDSDYLVMSDTLANCWGSINDVMINHDIENLSLLQSPTNRNIDALGIKMYWATVIYFRKSEIAQYLFSIVKNIFENYEFYCQLYLITSSMFRNDYAFSIAVHMLNGFSEVNNTIPQLPVGKLLMSFDTDDLYSVNNVNDITCLVEKPNTSGLFLAVRCKNTDIHVMNKQAVSRHSDKLINLYKDLIS